MHTGDLAFEWDPDKDRINQAKHGIRFADAVTVFQDEYARVVEDDNPVESRFVPLGRDANGEVLVVVFTWRREKIRVILARRAGMWENQQYQTGK